MTLLMYNNLLKGSTNMDNIKKLQNIIDESNNIVFFGGAGVSTESGIKDFRGIDGLYNEKYDYQPEYYLSLKCFRNQPEVFYNFYKTKMNCLDAEPNVTHLYLSQLEKNGKLKAVVTQNIDGLHQKAGSSNVLEIHGTMRRNHCVECGKEYNAEFIFNSTGIPKCDCAGIIKPDVVLYGDNLPEAFLTAQDYIREADTLIVAGTSLTVEPASSLLRLFDGKNLVIINKDKTPYDRFATLVINDELSNIFKELH